MRCIDPSCCLDPWKRDQWSWLKYKFTNKIKKSKMCALTWTPGNPASPLHASSFPAVRCSHALMHVDGCRNPWPTSPALQPPPPFPKTPGGKELFKIKASGWTCSRRSPKRRFWFTLARKPPVKEVFCLMLAANINESTFREIAAHWHRSLS